MVVGGGVCGVWSPEEVELADGLRECVGDEGGEGKEGRGLLRIGARMRATFWRTVGLPVCGCFEEDRDCFMAVIIVMIVMGEKAD